MGSGCYLSSTSWGRARPHPSRPDPHSLYLCGSPDQRGEKLRGDVGRAPRGMKPAAGWMRGACGVGACRG
eukprot:4723092-Prymnesium_polylepis.1